MQSASKAQGTLLIAPLAMTNSQTATANLDCRGAAYATIAICFGAEKNTNALGPTIALSEGDDTVVTNFTAISAGAITGADGDLANAMFRLYHVNVADRGGKRYLRLSLTTETTTNDDITACVFATLTRLGEAPGSTTDMVATTNDVAVVM